MNLSEKLLTQYIGGKGYTSPLQKFITSIGMPYHRMSKQEIYKVGDSKRYKEWIKLQRVLKMVDKTKKVQEAAYAPPIGQASYSKKYKHIDPTHIAKKKLITSLIGKGYSPEGQSLTAKKATKFGKAKVKVGKRTYKALKKGHKRFREITFDPNKTGRTKTLRTLKRQAEYKGKAVKLYANYEEKYKNYISELEAKTYDEKVDTTNPDKVQKLVNKNKELKTQNGSLNGKEIQLPKPMTGSSNTQNYVELNPTSDLYAYNQTQKNKNL